MIITHKQITDPVFLSFAGLTATLQDGNVFLVGNVALKGEVYRVSNDFSLAEPFAAFLHDDGTVSTDAAGAYAMICWWDGENLNVITHAEAPSA